MPTPGESELTPELTDRGLKDRGEHEFVTRHAYDIQVDTRETQRMLVSPVEPSLRRRWAAFGPLRVVLRWIPSWGLKWFIAGHVLIPAFRRATVRVSCGDRIEWQFRGDTAIGAQFVAFGRFEAQEIEVALRRATAGGTVFDVGANVGLFALPIALAGSAHVVAFEPLEPNLQVLRRNIAAQGLQNIEVVDVAVGDRVGEMRYSLEGDGALASINEAGADGVWDVETLDRLWDARGRPFVPFIKIDVEGYEHEVIAGGMELLHEQTPDLLIEANSKDAFDKLAHQLAPLGYVAAQPSRFEKYNYLFAVPSN